MGIVLVLAGTHQEFMGWMRNVYGGRAFTQMSAPRFVNRAHQVMGLTADAVDAFHQVGTYWNNPLWNDEAYHRLMQDGLAEGKAWAMSWETDWIKACQLRDPVTPAEFAEARRRLVELQKDLAEW